MDNTNSLIIELLNLIDKKRRLFDDIMEITVEQKKDIEENEADNIEALVNRKQSVIDGIDEIDRTFSEGFSRLKEQLNINSLEELDFTKYPVLKSLKLKVAEIMSLAQKIMEIEESNREKLSSRLNALKKDMKQLNVGKKSIKAYQNPIINSDGIYIDKKK